MKILFLCPYFYPHIGGVEKHSFEVAKKLIEKGYSVSVITEKSSSSEKTLDTVGKINIYRFNAGRNNWFKKFRIWKEVWNRRKLILEADIIHCHDVFFWFLPFRFLYPWKKVYTTFHGYEGKFPPQDSSVFIRKISEEFSRGSICVGSYIKKWYGTKPNYITYGAADRVQSLRFKVQNHRTLKILLVGRLDKDIGVEIYLETLSLLRRKGIKFNLSVIGDGSFRKEIQKFGKVYGFVKNLEQYIDKSNIVFSSSYLTILWAFSNGKLVFATFDNPLKKDYLEMTPFRNWIVMKDNSGELALDIQKYLKSPNKYNKNIKEAYKWVNKQSWDKLTNIYLKLWKA